MRCFDFTAFHRDCANVDLASGPNGLFVVCLDCRVAAELEAVSAKVSPADATKSAKELAGFSRKSLGKMSPGINVPGSAD